MEDTNTPVEEEVPSIDTTGNELDRITQKEYDALQEFKKRDCTKGLNDKFLMIFLLGRKLDVQRAETLLQSHLTWCKANNHENPISLREVDPTLVQKMYTDKEGHGINYIIPARLGKMKDHTAEEHLNYMFWWWRNTQEETLDFHRKGVIVIEDLKDVAMKNFDMGIGNKITKATENNFPMRIKKIYILNPNKLFRVLIRIARLLLKKKLTERVEVVTVEQLSEIVDPSQLHDAFGGELKFSPEDMASLDAQFQGQSS